MWQISYVIICSTSGTNSKLGLSWMIIRNRMRIIRDEMMIRYWEIRYWMISCGYLGIWMIE